jgi:hypothetical protein
MQRARKKQKLATFEQLTTFLMCVLFLLCCVFFVRPTKKSTAHTRSLRVFKAGGGRAGVWPEDGGLRTAHEVVAP